MSRLIRPRRAHRQLVLLLAALAGGVLAAHPTNVGPLDVLWSAAFVTGIAYFSAYSTRMVTLSATGVASLLADSGPSLGFAIAAVAVAAANAGQARASHRWSTVAGGLLGLSLLTGSGPGSTAVAVVCTTAVTLVIVGAGVQGMSRRRQRWAIRSAAALAGAVVLCALVGVTAVLMARSKVDDGIDAFRAAQAVGTGGDLDGAVTEFRKAERAFRDASGPLSTFGRIGRIVPGLSQQLAAVDTAVDAAGDAAQAARRAGTSVDLEAVGLNSGAFDIEALARTESPVAQLEADLSLAVSRLLAIDRSFLVPQVSDALDDALAEAGDALATTDRLHRAVQVAPGLLGSERPTRYLMLFTTPVEARNRLGFPGSYAVLSLDGGRISFERAGPINDLDPDARGFDQLALTIPPRAQPYLGYGISRNWRQVTLPAHGPAAASVIVQLAEQSGLGTIDGVVYAAPEALAAIVGLLGGVDVPLIDVSLTQETTVDFLTRQQYLAFPELGQQDDRKDLLEVVAGVVGLRLQQLSVPEARDLIDLFGPLVDQGSLAFSVPDAINAPAADLLADVGLDGGFPRPNDADADVVFVGQRNNVGNKIDLFLERSLDYAANVDEDGTVAAELTVTLRNTAPASGLPFYLIGSAADPPPPSGTNRSTTLIYSRFELVEVTVDGVTAIPPVLFEGGFYVYQVQVELGPGQERTISARLTGAAPSSEPHEVVVYPNGLLHPDFVTVRVSDARFGTERDESATVRTPWCVSLREGEESCG